jgi:hypothetical protein
MTKFLKIYFNPDDVVITYLLFLVVYNVVNVAAYIFTDIIEPDMIEGLFYASFLGALLSIACFFIMGKVLNKMTIGWIYFLPIAILLLEIFTYIFLGRSFLYIYLFSHQNSKNTIGIYLLVNNYLTFTAVTILKVLIQVRKNY